MGRVSGRGSRTSALVAAVLMATLVAACSAAPSASPPSPSGPAQTQWDAVLSGIGPDGSVDVDTAAAAFSLAIGPLPGVALPDGSKPTPAEVVDGSSPIRWLIRLWDQLSPDQQAASTRLIAGLGSPDFSGLPGSRALTGAVMAPSGPRLGSSGTRLASNGKRVAPTGTASSLGAPGATPQATGETCGIWLYGHDDTIATTPVEIRAYAEDLNKAAVAFAGHLGRDPVAKWGACLLPSGRISAGSATVVYDADGGHSGEADHCVIGLNPDYFNGLKGSDPGGYGYSLSMAAFRCFLATAAYYGPSVRAPYVEDGLTAWSAATVSSEVLGGPGTAVVGAWVDYLTQPGASLYQRSFDAIGFYAQLNDVEPMWQYVDPMLRADGAENAFFASGARDPKFSAIWASGYFRDLNDGTAWDILGPGVAPDKAERDPIEIANGDKADLAADPLTVSISEATSTADVTYVTGSDLRIADGQLDVVFHSSDIEFSQKAYCTKDGGSGDCTCPPDTLGAKLPPPGALKSPFHVALTGMVDGGSGSLKGLSLEDYCAGPPASPAPSAAPDDPKGGPNPCASGCAGSYGDTHLRTVDLQQYDFQAAGEYVLLRSHDGSMEIQGREVPYPGISDTSINTALAWKVGTHRVTMYSHGDRYEARLDGKALDPVATGTLDLGQGAALTLLADGVEVAFPDGTITTALFHGNGIDGALDLEIAPSADLKQGTVGLLGPIGKGSELPVMPDGTALPLSTDRGTRYQQRYAQLGPAWHVTAQSSLFEYDAGQSTTTFDKPGFPSTNVAFDVKELEARLTAEVAQDAADICNQVQDDETLYAACVYDVLATADPNFGHFYGQVAQFLVDGPSALDVCNPPATPGGFAVVPCVPTVTGVAPNADGTLDIGIVPGTRNASAEVIEVDPGTGRVLKRVPAASNATVAVAAGSLWIGSGDFSGGCILRRLDPTTYRQQAKISLPCGSENGVFVATADTVWVEDGSTLRPVDLSSNTLGAGIPLPVDGAKLLGTGSIVYAGTRNDSPGTWYRLGPGDTAFRPLGALPGTSGLAMIAGGGALWLQDLDGVKRYTTSASPDGPTLTVDGTLVAADERALYVARDDQASSHFELWRYPIDGSAPAKVAENNLAFPITIGSFYLSYSNTSGIVPTQGKLVVVWEVPAGIGVIGSTFIQVVPNPG
jgi:hypothetical protein